MRVRKFCCLSGGMDVRKMIHARDLANRLLFTLLGMIVLILVGLAFFFPKDAIGGTTSLKRGKSMQGSQKQSIAAGGNHSLALLSDGTVKSWGYNNYGQLGDDASYVNKPTPVSVSGISNAVAISAGDEHSLALLSDGTIKSWGYDIYGQLGDDSYTNKPTPVSVSGISNAVAIAAGGYHSLALLSDGTVKSWGYDYYGQLGDDASYVNKPVPVSVSGISNAVAIAAGLYHSLALLSDGTIKSWGYNNYGQLGDDSYTNKPTPVTVSGITNAIAIVAGTFHSLALLSDGTVKSWGNDGSGQLGDDASYVNKPTPVSVSDISGVVAIAGGGYHSLAILSDGTVKSWGNDGWGQLGDDAIYADKPTPVSVSGISNTVAISAAGHSLALLADGTVKSWGYDGYGQLGDDASYTDKPTPVRVLDIANTVAIAAGNYHSLALLSDGTIKSWGRDDYGQLGDDASLIDKPTPVTVSGINNAVAIAAGGFHSLALLSDGTVRSWGYDAYGQLGDDASLTDKPTPVSVSGISNAVAIAAGGYHSLALLSDGTVKSWGYDDGGQLGDDVSLTSKPTPVTVSGISNAIAIAAGEFYSLALLSDGTIRSWGEDGSGQLGDDASLTSKPTPVSVSGISNAVAIATGGYHSLALLSDGTVKSWGYDNVGQLGDDASLTSKPTPVSVPGISNAIAIAAGDFHTLVLLSDETVKSWGWDGFGQLGDDASLTSKPTPVSVSGISNAVAIAAGGYHSLALLSDGTIRSWGDDGSGQLGDDANTTDKPTPVTVSGIRTAKLLQSAKRLTLDGGDEHSLALLSDGTVESWGRDNSGQLGDDSNLTDKSIPVDVQGISNAIAIAGGWRQSMALLSDGTVKSWGNDSYGQLGDDANLVNKSTAVPVSGISNAVAIAAGGYHSLVLLSNGTVKAWGRDNVGQLGDDANLVDRPTAVIVPGINNAVAIAAGWDHSLALLSDGTIKSWGRDNYGQLGDDANLVNQPTAVIVPGINNAVAIAAGLAYSLALLSDGTIKSWGYDIYGQLGDDANLVNQPTPVNVSGISSVVAIAAGNYHSLALLSDGTIRSWGYDGDGQLGDDANLVNRPTPVTVSGIINAAAVAAGGYHSIALTSDGIIRSWGDDYSGQLGDDTDLVNKPTPVNVSLNYSSTPAYDATYLVLGGFTNPMKPGGIANFIVKITNTSSFTWKRSTTGVSNPVNLAFHWYNGSGQLVAWDCVRTKLPRDVAPGESVTVNPVVTAPNVPGSTYILKFDLVKEGVTWFSSQGLAMSANQTANLGGNYGATYTVSNGFPDPMEPGGFNDFTVQLTNTGFQAWNSTGPNPVRLAFHWYDGNGNLVAWDCVRTPIPDVPVGGSIPVISRITTPNVPGSTYILKFDLVKEGVTWFSSQGVAMSANQTANLSNYGATYSVTAGGFPNPMTPGSKHSFTVHLTNTGYFDWVMQGNGANPVNLAFHWYDINGNLVAWDCVRAKLNHNVVREVGTDDITTEITAPNVPNGVYILRFDLVREGVTWFSSQGVSMSSDQIVNMTSYGATYNVTGGFPSPTMPAGTAALFTVQLANTGSFTWLRQGGGANPVRLAFHWYNGAGQLVAWDCVRADLTKNVVAGDTDTIATWITTPNVPGATYILKFDLVREGVTWFSSKGVPMSAPQTANLQ
jgi:alpha-tubulin suppressor-like RCC1 family protein